jgi:hypothetical protein
MTEQELKEYIAAWNLVKHGTDALNQRLFDIIRAYITQWKNASIDNVVVEDFQSIDGAENDYVTIRGTRWCSGDEDYENVCVPIWYLTAEWEAVSIDIDRRLAAERAEYEAEERRRVERKEQQAKDHRAKLYETLKAEFGA